MFNNQDPMSGYMGKNQLKRPNAQIEWTADMIKEYNRCRTDIIYFIEKYIKIINVDEGVIDLKLRNYQKNIVRTIHGNRRTILACTRQSGKTTSVVACIVHYVLFNPAKTVAILANRLETAIEILSRVQLAYESLPKWLQQGVVEYNKSSFALENKSRVLADATSSSAIRGYSINMLVLDEVAHVERWEEFFTSTYPTISSGKTTKIVMVSTPKGLNHFWKFWQDANKKPGEKGYNGFAPIKVTWREVPGRDAAWAEQEKSVLGEEKFNQEHEVEFLGSTHTLISSSKLKTMAFQTPLAYVGSLHVFEQPIPAHKYVIVADVSRGKGLDYSAFSVIDVSNMPYKQVARYRDNMISPLEYAEVLYNTCKSYNMPDVLIELNDLGKQTVDALFGDYEYEHLLWTCHAGRGGKTISMDGTGQQAEQGITVTKTVKNLGCAMIKELIEKDQLIIQDFDTIAEFSTYSKSKRMQGFTYEAEEGHHDDLVAGLVLFGWFTDQQYFKEMTSSDIRAKLKAKSEEAMADLKPFGYFYNGFDDFFGSLDDDEFGPLR